MVTKKNITKKVTPQQSKTIKKKEGAARKVKHKSSFKKIVTALSISLFISSIFLAFVLVSYLMNWRADQAFIDPDLAITGEIVVKNICGKLGAYIGDVIIGQWFGFFGVLLPIPIFTMGIFLSGISPRLFIKITIVTFTGLMILPTAATFVTPFADPTLFGSGIGGAYGNYICSILKELSGVVGTALVLILTTSLWLIYAFPYSSRWFESAGHSIKDSASKIGETINNRESKSNNDNQEPINEDNVENDDTSDEDNQNITEFEKEAEILVTNSVENDDNNPFITYSSNNNSVLESNTIITNDDEVLDPNPTLKEEELINGFTTKIRNSYDEVEVSISNPQENEPEELFDENQQPKQQDKDYQFSVSITENAIISEDADTQDTKIEILNDDMIEEDQFDQSVFDPTLELSSYKLPAISLLDNITSKVTVTNEELKENTKRIVDTLENFNIKVDKIHASIGPTVTLYEIKPAPGVRISTIKRLEDDIALSLSALGIRIVAPIPGKDAIGIEVPNKNKEIVSMSSVIKSVEFQNSDADLPVVLGKTIQNEPFVIDLAKMPHLLVAGATGQGKSVGLNAIITSLLYKKHPAELKFVMIDPKKVEFSLYSAIENHYLAKLPDEEESIIIDTQKVIFTLNSLCLEMDNRYELLKVAKVRNIKEYNNKFKERRLNPKKGHRFLPYFVVIIDEFGDLILTAGKEIETPLTRLAALARAVGIHLVIATQRPTTNIITGSIKANFPARIAFRVISGIDSKTILDTTGANQLIGRGDMLILANNDITRVQCAFIDTHEVERITDFIKSQTSYGSPYSLPEFIAEVANKDDDGAGMTYQRDALFDKVARYVVGNQQGSASTIQRNFEIGFNRAGRIMDQLEKAGVVGKQIGSKPRQVLIQDLTSLELHLIDIDKYKY